MQAPVKIGDAHGFPGIKYGRARADGWIDEMHDGFGHAKEHQADAHAGGEQHGKPGDVAVIGLAVVRPQLDVAVTAEGQEEDRSHYDGNRPEEHTSELKSLK